MRCRVDDGKCEALGMHAIQDELLVSRPRVVGWLFVDWIIPSFTQVAYPRTERQW